MSADNWAVCPRCLQEERARRKSLTQQIREGYGTLSIEEFTVLRIEEGQPFEEEKFRTFREDCEFFGVHKGRVTATYSGHCQKCGLGLDFEDTHPIPGLNLDG